MFKSKKIAIVFIFLLLVSASTQAQFPKVPGIVVKYIPSKTGVYIGSPSICILPNGDYVASHDHFGSNSTEHEIAVTAANMVKEEFSHLPAAKVRNTLVLKSSPDLKNRTVHKILLEHPDVEKHGFQYVDWQFNGRHIIFLSRTAYDDEYGGAHNYHDANYLTFHRIKNFRKFSVYL
jgi:hypothetical protein